MERFGVVSSALVTAVCGSLLRPLVPAHFSNPLGPYQRGANLLGLLLLRLFGSLPGLVCKFQPECVHAHATGDQDKEASSSASVSAAEGCRGAESLDGVCLRAVQCKRPRRPSPSKTLLTTRLRVTERACACSLLGSGSSATLEHNTQPRGLNTCCYSGARQLSCLRATQ